MTLKKGKLTLRDWERELRLLAEPSGARALLCVVKSVQSVQSSSGARLRPPARPVLWVHGALGVL